jgi:hypothetical protein
VSGFLARLTARAGGDQPPAVRPRHRSLFEPGRATQEGPAPLSGMTPPQALRPEPSPWLPEPSPRPPHAQPTSPLPPPVAPRSGSEDEPVVVPAPAIPDVPSVASVPVQVSSATAPPLPPAEHLAEPAREHDAEPPPNALVARLPEPVAAVPRVRAPAVREPRPEPATPRLQEDVESPRSSSREPRLARTMRGREPPATRRSTPRLTHSDQEPPIVHVTIGRVEVRATPDQKPDNAADSRRRPAMRTLDAYLTQRAEARR